MNNFYNLTKSELDTLSYLLYYDYLNKDISNIDKRMIIVFDYDTKRAISDYMKCPMQTISNTITSLRKKKYNGKPFIIGKKLNYDIPFLPVEIKDSVKLSFNFNIVKDEVESKS